MLDPLFIANLAVNAANLVEQQEGAESIPASKTIPASLVTEQQRIQREIEKLLMITEALWRIVKEEHGYSDELLIQKIQEVDMRDGTLDGRVSKSAERPTCPKCGRVIIRNQHACLFCGAPVEQKPFER
jgi:hypothetical protein